MGNAHGLGDHLPVATAKLAAMRSLAFDEVHTHRPRRLRAQLLNLQAVDAHLHSEGGGIVLQRQAQAFSPRPGLLRILSCHRLDPDTRALLFHRSHPKNQTKPLMNRQPRPIQAISRYSARAQRARLPCQILFPSA
ncbi:hypothetical protein D3C81_1792110 [compost metagenome]